MQDKLRYDEAACGDLYDRMACKRFADYARSSNNGNEYFIDPYRSQQWGPMVCDNYKLIYSSILQ